jgi:hypothetical protein
MIQVPYALHIPIDRLLHYWGPLALVGIVIVGGLVVRWILTRPDDPT